MLIDLFNHNFQLAPPDFLMVVLLSFRSSGGLFVAVGFLHSMKFRDPYDPIAPIGLRANKQTINKSNQIQTNLIRYKIAFQIRD